MWCIYFYIIVCLQKVGIFFSRICLGIVMLVAIYSKETICEQIVPAASSEIIGKSIRNFSTCHIFYKNFCACEKDFIFQIILSKY